MHRERASLSGYICIIREGGRGQNYGDFCVPADPNLDCLCVQQVDAAPFCENYAKHYFDAKHFEREWNREW